MKVFSGKTIYKGIAVGPVCIMKAWEAPVHAGIAASPEAEEKRILRAKKIAKEQLMSLHERTREELGESEAAVFNAYRMILEDEAFHKGIMDLILQEHVSAETAVEGAGKKFAAMLEELDDRYMKERAADVQNVSMRLLHVLNGTGGKICTTTVPSVILADNLTPGELMKIDRSQILALVLTEGSEHSHTAILARMRNIPCIFEVHLLLEEVCDGTEMIVDGFQGEVILNPTGEMVRSAKQQMRHRQQQESMLKRLKGKDNITRSGKKVNILANINDLSDVQLAKENDAGGIGLFRSEFLYLGRKKWPTEEEQLDCYQQVLRKMGSSQTVIRTLDLGEDKQVLFEEAKERGIQFSLSHPEVFKTQIRALMRTNTANLQILYPMVSDVGELQRIQMLLEEAHGELESCGIQHRFPGQGVMVETVEAVGNCETLVQMADFISIGTNDLTRSLMERGVSEGTYKEKLLSMIQRIIEAAHKYGKKVCICGELAADMEVTEALINMGIDEFSVAPSIILPLRQRIREIP